MTDDAHGAEASDDLPAANPYALTAPEPPQRMTGWRHLPPERWRLDRIRPAPYNDKVRRITADKRARLRAGVERFGLVGTFTVRAEDGLLIGGHRRFEIARLLIAANSDNLTELERLNLYGRVSPRHGFSTRYGDDDVSIAVSPILGISDADALALNILLNNREAQGEFIPMGLGEALSVLDAAGHDITATGFDYDFTESLVTWEPDDTREGGAKSAGAEPPPANVARGTRAQPLAAPAPLVLPCTRADVRVVCDMAGWQFAILFPGPLTEEERERLDRLSVALSRVRGLLDLSREVLGDEPPLDFGADGAGGVP